jgi:adhesin HecA-like repeat protein
VTTRANYIITPGSSTSTLTWRNGFGLDLVAGDVIAVTSWNATDQQNILTKVFVGSVTEGLTLIEGYDTTDFDAGTVSGAAGSFDYSEGIVIAVNNFDLGRTITDSSRLWVTRNGFRLFAGQDFVIEGEQLILAAGVISAADTVVITMFTDNIVPDALAFRVFQDMRGVQATYRITSNSTTQLVDTLLPTDDVVRVRSAAALAVPDLNNNIWGVLTVNGERILYRDIDLVNNTVSSLLRGTAGTAITTHAAGSVVYNLSRINLAPAEYQDRLVSAKYLSDGVETEFELDVDLASFVGIKDITDPDDKSSLIPWPVLDAIEVYVGGVLQPKSSYFVPSISPVTVVFDDAPTEGQEIVIVVRQGLSWYEPGVNTASNGRPLQETDTIAARFFRGLY